jgi:hypothetical protein
MRRGIEARVEADDRVSEPWPVQKFQRQMECRIVDLAGTMEDNSHFQPKRIHRSEWFP